MERNTENPSRRGQSVILAAAVVVVLVAAGAVALVLEERSRLAPTVVTPPAVREARRPTTSPLEYTRRAMPRAVPATPKTPGVEIEVGPVKVLTPPATPARRPAKRAVATKRTASKKAPGKALNGESRILRGLSEILASARAGNTGTAADDRVPHASDSRRAAPPEGRVIKDIELRRLQREHRAAINYCYDQARLSMFDLPSKVIVRVRLGAKGEVGRVVADSGARGELRACLERNIRAWTFPRDLRPQTVSFAVVFLPTN